MATNFEPMDQKEVELRAQSGENSQLFMDSQFSNANSGGVMQMMNRFNNLDGFGPTEFGEDQNQAAMGVESKKITINLEDAVLEEQKLS